MSEQDGGAIARAIVDSHRYMTIASSDATGRPWASPVYYAAAEYTEFFWVSSPEVTHSRNIAARPAAAAGGFGIRSEIRAVKMRKGCNMACNPRFGRTGTLPPQDEYCWNGFYRMHSAFMLGSRLNNFW